MTQIRNSTVKSNKK